MRRTFACLAVLVGGAVWLEACGGDDSGGSVPSETSADAGPMPPAQDAAGADVGTDANVQDAATDAAEAGSSLDGGSCDGGLVGVTQVSPKFAYTNAATPITITGTNFVSLPRVFLIDAAKNQKELTNVAFVSSTSITATVPSGLT